MKFAAVTSWSFTDELAEQLKALPNMEVLPSFHSMDEVIFERERKRKREGGRGRGEGGIKRGRNERGRRSEKQRM